MEKLNPSKPTTFQVTLKKPIFNSIQNVCLACFVLFLSVNNLSANVVCNVVAESSNGNISINGLTSNANTKLFDASYNTVFECNPWNGNLCSENATVSNLTIGATYFLSVQSDFCREWIPIVVKGSADCPDMDGDGTCDEDDCCLLYTSPSPRDRTRSRMPSSA